MLKVVLSKQFAKDLKLALKRGYDIDLLDNVVDKLARGEALDKNTATTNCPVNTEPSENVIFFPIGFLFTELKIMNLYFSLHERVLIRIYFDN